MFIQTKRSYELVLQVTPQFQRISGVVASEFTQLFG